MSQLSPELLAALEADALEIGPAQLAQLEAFAARIREENEFLSLVSQGDLAAVEEKHFTDCLATAALLQHFAAGLHLDIGSGAGFPGIVLAIAIPDLPVLLFERSAKKSDFLEGLVQSLKLENADVLCGDFPVDARSLSDVTSVTARAVEKPERTFEQILNWMPRGATYLCQYSATEPPLPKGVSQIPLPTLASAPFRRGTVRLYRRH